jgi:Family of unknown function (DUF6455)
MQTRNPRSTEKLATSDKHDELLDCRMAMLGIDLKTIESGDSETFDKIRRECMSCGYREACAVDLQRDPNSPVWETYCPNSEKLVALAEAWWAAH